MKRIVAAALLVCLLAGMLSGCSGGGAEGKKALPARETAVYAVLDGTTGDRYIEETYPNAKRLVFDSLGDAVAALQAGKADYVITAYTNCLNFVRGNKDSLVCLPDRLSHETNAIAINKGETALRERIDEVLARFREDGTLDKIISNWVREDESDYVREEIPVRETGEVLKVAISAEREPMCFVENGVVTGLDVELIKRIAYELDMRVEFSDMKFSAMITSVLSGKTPIAISNITATDERRESVDFSEGYFTNPQSLITRTEFDVSSLTEDTGYTTLASLAGKRIGIKTGSIFDTIALGQWPDAKLLYYEGEADLVIALQQDKIDAFLDDQPVARQITHTTPGLTIVPEQLEPDEYGFAFAKTKEGEKLRDEFDEFVKTAENGKLLETLDALWFGDDEEAKVIEDAASLPATNGVIRFAGDMQSPPLGYLKNEKPAGYETDIITRFCKAKGYGLEISVVTFASLLPGLVSGRYDAVASSISITEERAKSVSFSKPTYTGGMVVIVKGESEAEPKDVATSRIGAMTGTTCEAYAQATYPDAEYSSFSSGSDLMTALKNGKIDYAVLTEILTVNYMRTDASYEIAGTVLESDNYCIAISKEQTGLRDGINAVLERFKTDGTLDKLRESWVRPDGSAYTVTEIPEVAEGPTLTVAYCSELEPNCFILNGEPAGYDVELLRRIAYELGYKLKFEDMQFAAIIPALQSGRAEVAVATIAYTEERAQQVDFSDPYYEDKMVLARYKAAEVKTDFFASVGESFNRTFIVEQRWKLVLSGIGVTLLISLCAGLLGVLLGFLFTLARRSHHRVLGSTVKVLMKIMQGTPMVVLLMIMYYIIFNKTGLDGIAVSIITFGLSFGGSVCGTMLAGIGAIDAGQSEAAAAIGFSERQTFMKIIFPQAAKHFMPILKGEYISLVKLTSIVGYVAVQDLTKISDIIRSRTYEAFFPLIVTAIIYFLLSNALTSLLRFVEVKIDPKHRARTLKGVKL